MTTARMTPKAAQAWVREALPIYDFLDLSIDSLSDGILRCSAPLSHNNGDQYDTMQAAVIWALAELSGELAMFSQGFHEDYLTVVRHVRIDFRRPAATGVRAEVEFSDADFDDLRETLEAEDACDYEVLSIVRDEEGRIVAEATCSYSLRPKPVTSAGKQK